MTHKDFVLIAGALAEARNHWLIGNAPCAESFNAALEAVRLEMARVLSGTNPRFDRQRFLAAARGEPMTGPGAHMSARRFAPDNVEVFQMTAQEVASQDEDLVYEFSKRHEFRLCHMNGRTQEAMLDAIVAERGITGGWCYWYCLPGCMPDSSTFGPFETREEAIADAWETFGDEEG